MRKFSNVSPPKNVRCTVFESPDSAIDATYYYRWELVTKHLTYGSPETGYTFTEFIDRPFWSGAYGAISCPLGHQFAELRWLNDHEIVRQFARYWFATPGAQPRSYSNWYASAMWGLYEVTRDSAFLHQVLPHMKHGSGAGITGRTRNVPKRGSSKLGAPVQGGPGAKVS
jgi:hypothetical protein